MSLAAVLNSYASDSDRITQLEKEVQELKLRLTNLEPPQGVLNGRQKPVAAIEGWKHLANWRALKKGMTPAGVRATLGEPERIRSGTFDVWTYSSSGNVTFYKHKVEGWSEPRQVRCWMTEFNVYGKFLTCTAKICQKLTSILTFSLFQANGKSKRPKNDLKSSFLGARSGCRPIGTSVRSY
ncbi:MAG: hypothetical protein V4542_09095 [Pseudomonadota bacterium]